MACQSGTNKVTEDFVPQKNPGVCEPNFSPIPVTRTDMAERVGSLAGLPKGTYTLKSTELFIDVAGTNPRVMTYATQMLDGTEPPFPSCTAGVENGTPLINVTYDAVKAYTYSNAQQLFVPTRFTVNFGPNVPTAVSFPSPDLNPTNGVIAYPGGYTELKVYEISATQFEIRAIKGAVVSGKNVGMSILQKFSYAP
jgi:hypothetical protein